MRLWPPGRHFSAPRLVLVVKRLLFFVPRTSLNLLGGRKVLFLISRAGSEYKSWRRTNFLCKGEGKNSALAAAKSSLAAACFCGTFSRRRGSKSNECDGLFRCFCKQSINCRVPFAVFVVATQSSISLSPDIY